MISELKKYFFSLDFKKLIDSLYAILYIQVESLLLKNNMMLELSKILDNVNLVRLSSIELKFRQQMISRAKNNK